MDIAGLPEDDRKAIAAGASAKTILARKATADRQKRIQERVDEDQKTGTLSDAAATIILEFCRSGNDLRKALMIRGIFPILLDNVESLVRSFEASGRRAVKVSKKVEPYALFRKTRPRKAKNAPALPHQAGWLAEVLWLIAPESPIRASAILKARRRSGELLPKRTPIESWNDAYSNSEARKIELSNIPPRKVYSGGARLMPRHGRASPSPDPTGRGNTDSKA
jgi:hypothetical protein